MLAKIVSFIVIIIMALLIGGLYGILHDQFTYTIAPEYYTKFKFYQFNLMKEGNEAIFSNPRIQVSKVGFLATWWMGIPIGIILGLVGFIHKDYKRMIYITFVAFLITMIIAFIIGLTGLAYGYFYLNPNNINWWLPENLIHKKQFIMVGSMHNFSYVGGIIGLIVGTVYSIQQKKFTAK